MDYKEYLSQIGKRGGTKTAQIHKERGGSHFKLMAKRSVEARKKKKLSTT